MATSHRLKNLVKKETGKPGQRPEVISYRTMRLMIGCLALALPWTVWLGYIIFASQEITPLSAISEYYYTLMRDVFVGTLCAVAFFLFAYKGYKDQDMIISENAVFNFAGALSLTVAFFSMNLDDCANLNAPLSFCDKIAMEHHCFFGWLHLGAAGVLFTLLGFVSIFFFTKTSDKLNRTPQKRRRDVIYIVCGVIIWVALVVYLVCSLVEPIKTYIGSFPILFWVETVSLEAFGISWLVKGEPIAALRG